MKHLKIFLVLTCICPALFAQKKTDHYPNGNIAFEGEYTYTWNGWQYLDFEWTHSDETLMLLNQVNKMMPRKKYDGECTFYSITGKKIITGHFKDGIPDGRFTYQDDNGAAIADNFYNNGMPYGAFRTYQQGILVSEGVYKPLTQKQLAEAYRTGYVMLSRHERESEYDNDDPLNMRGRAHIRYNYQTEDLETLFFNYFELNSIWNGRMVAYNRQGKIILEAYFLDNVPERTWKVYKDDGTPNYDLTFKNGKLVEYTDHIHNTKDNIGNNKPRQPLVGAGDPQGIDPGVTQPTPPSVFTYVEQMPSPPYDLNNYLSKTIKYPEEAQKSAIDGRVIIKFVVNEDGSISNAEVIRTLDPYCDKEAIRVINNMPIWKPGKQNGKAVKVYFTLPITFRLVQEEMKK